MDVARLQRLARVLRETALRAAEQSDDDRLGAGAMAVVGDLAQHGTTTVGEVARRTGLAQSMVSTTVAGLREAGVVTSRADPGDGRRVLVTLSAPARAQILSRAARPVTPALRETLLRALPPAGRPQESRSQQGEGGRGSEDLDAAAHDLERLLDTIADQLVPGADRP